MDDSDDDKPLLAQKAKAKTKAKAKANSAIQKECARQKVKKADEQQIAALIEEAIPKPRKIAKVTANLKMMMLRIFCGPVRKPPRPTHQT